MDVDEGLAQLRTLRTLKSAADEQIKALQAELIPLLTEPTYFLDDQGAKRYGYVQRQTTVVVNLDLLEALCPEVIEEVTNRKIDLDAFKQAAAAGRIPQNVLVQVASEVPKATFVAFGSPDGDGD